MEKYIFYPLKYSTYHNFKKETTYEKHKQNYIKHRKEKKTK